MLLALYFLASATSAAPAAAPAPHSQPAAATFTRQDQTDQGGAVPLDWAGPAARTPGADASVQELDPSKSLFGDATSMCVVVAGQPLPPCASKPQDGLQVTSDIFTSSVNPDSTCQTIEDVRLGADGKPQRVFATVCGDEAESWNYRQRATPSSAANPTRSTNRKVGPNDVNAPRSPGS